MKSLPTPDEIIKKWSEDCTIDSTNIQFELSRSANLYSYYLDFYMKYRVKKRQVKSDLEEAEKTSLDWLKGRIKVNGQTFPFKLLSEEVKIHKSADPKVQTLRERLEAVDIAVDVLTRILKQIEQRSFDLRAIRDMKKLEIGDGI